tara:strand:- start:410 stop:1123 length:714 start_codon:yes stop_codon:yes gene_type:complete
MTDKKILITGAPRGATKSTAIFLYELGLDIHHERNKKNGTVSSLHTHLHEDYDVVLHQTREPLASIKSLHKLNWISYDFYQDIPEDIYDNDKLLMNYLPLSEIRLLNSHKPESYVAIKRWKDILPKIKDTNLTRQCMKAWLEFNLEAQFIASWTYRVEDLQNKEIFREWLERMGIPYSDDYFDRYTKGRYSKNKINVWNGPPAPDLSWEMLANLDSDLTRRIISCSHNFGYNPNFNI